jgi:hypothetical protein
LKTDKFTVNQNFIFNTVQEVEKSLKEQINALYKSTGINAKFSMQYALKDKPSAENNDLLRRYLRLIKCYHLLLHLIITAVMKLH